MSNTSSNQCVGPTAEMRAAGGRVLWEKQFEGTPWAGKVHLIRPESMAEYEALAVKVWESMQLDTCAHETKPDAWMVLSHDGWRYLSGGEGDARGRMDNPGDKLYPLFRGPESQVKASADGWAGCQNPNPGGGYCPDCGHVHTAVDWSAVNGSGDAT